LVIFIFKKRPILINFLFQELVSNVQELKILNIFFIQYRKNQKQIKQLHHLTPMALLKFQNFFLTPSPKLPIPPFARWTTIMTRFLFYILFILFLCSLLPFFHTFFCSRAHHLKHIFRNKEQFLMWWMRKRKKLSISSTT
jgi:hypothetical protein